MNYSYQNTLVPNAPGVAKTLIYSDANGDAIMMFNCGVQTTQDPTTKEWTATISKVDGKGNVLSDANGQIVETGTGATQDAAILAAMTALGPRVIPAPVFTSASPVNLKVAGGDQVTISGKNFMGVTGVTIGGAQATNLAITQVGTQITCTTPAGTAGQADIVIEGPTASTTAPKAVTYA
jgi:hypothetical protein